MTDLYAALFCSSSQTDTEMQEHMGPPVFKLVARNSRKNSPFFKNDSNAPQSPLRCTPKQEPRDREGERTYQQLNKIKNKPTTLAREFSTVCLVSQSQLFKR